MNHRQKARSNYRQARVTFSQTMHGHTTYSVYVKPLEADWSELHCVHRGSLGQIAPAETPEDALRILVWCIEQHLLPGS